MLDIALNVAQIVLDVVLLVLIIRMMRDRREDES